MIATEIMVYQIYRWFIGGTPEIEDDLAASPRLQDALRVPEARLQSPVRQEPRPTELGQPPLRVVDGKPRRDDTPILNPLLARRRARPHLAPALRWIAPHNVEILRQASEDLMARLPRAAPHLGHKADHSHLSKIGEEKRGARLRASIQERGRKSPLNPPFYKGGKGRFLRGGSAVCHFVYRLLECLTKRGQCSRVKMMDARLRGHD